MDADVDEVLRIVIAGRCLDGTMPRKQSGLAIPCPHIRLAATDRGSLAGSMTSCGVGTVTIGIYLMSGAVLKLEAEARFDLVVIDFVVVDDRNGEFDRRDKALSNCLADHRVERHEQITSVPCALVAEVDADIRARIERDEPGLRPGSEGETNFGTTSVAAPNAL
jgi:hypothetical protein